MDQQHEQQHRESSHHGHRRQTRSESLWRLHAKSLQLGAVAAMPYAATVSGGAAVAFSANYSFSFSTVIVVGHLQGAELILETLTHFTDGSGRGDFYFSESMKK
jgi:hypothetical protein